MELIKKLDTEKISVEMEEIRKDLQADTKNFLRSTGAHIIEGTDPDLLIQVKNKRGPSYTIWPANSIQELGNTFLKLFPLDTEESFLFYGAYTPPLEVVDALGILHFLEQFCINGVAEFNVSKLYSNPDYEKYVNSRKFVSVFMNLVVHGKFFDDVERNSDGHDPRELVKNFYMCLWQRTKIHLTDLEEEWTYNESLKPKEIPNPKSEYGDYSLTI